MNLVLSVSFKILFSFFIQQKKIKWIKISWGFKFFHSTNIFQVLPLCLSAGLVKINKILSQSLWISLCSRETDRKTGSMYQEVVKSLSSVLGRPVFETAILGCLESDSLEMNPSSSTYTHCVTLGKLLNFSVL